MRVLIVSDTHRRDENFYSIIESLEPLDMVIHCGDAEGSDVQMRWKLNCAFLVVRGNNDFFSELPREVEISIGKYKAMITHGHYYNVNMGRERLVEEAKSRGFDIVMYGHTHRPIIEVIDGIMVLNPGSLSYPRQEGRRPSYIILDIDDMGDAHYRLCYFKQEQ